MDPMLPPIDPASAHLVDEYVQWRQAEEHVGFRLVGRIRGKALPYDAMPIRPMLSIEELLDVPRDVLLVFELPHGDRGLLHRVAHHVAALISVRLHLLPLRHRL